MIRYINEEREEEEEHLGMNWLLSLKAVIADPQETDREHEHDEVEGEQYRGQHLFCLIIINFGSAIIH